MEEEIRDLEEIPMEEEIIKPRDCLAPHDAPFVRVKDVVISCVFTGRYLQHDGLEEELCRECPYSRKKAD